MSQLPVLYYFHHVRSRFVWSKGFKQSDLGNLTIRNSLRLVLRGPRDDVFSLWLRLRCQTERTHEGPLIKTVAPLHACAVDLTLDCLGPSELICQACGSGYSTGLWSVTRSFPTKWSVNNKSLMTFTRSSTRSLHWLTQEMGIYPRWCVLLLGLRNQWPTRNRCSFLFLPEWRSWTTMALPIQSLVPVNLYHFIQLQ